MEEDEAVTLVQNASVDLGSDKEVADSPLQYPEFPEILSFFTKFSPFLDLSSPVIYSDLKNGAVSTKILCMYYLISHLEYVCSFYF